MRLWSLNPVLLDTKGLVSLWREGLLAQKVLMNKTKGYKFHPQLERFKRTNNPVASIDLYLKYVLEESRNRGYSFNSSKLSLIPSGVQPEIEVTIGQTLYEIEHLKNKLRLRMTFVHYEKFLEKMPSKLADCVHPIFQLVPGGVESWEKIKNPGGVSESNDEVRVLLVQKED